MDTFHDIDLLLDNAETLIQHNVCGGLQLALRAQHLADGVNYVNAGLRARRIAGQAQAILGQSADATILLADTLEQAVQAGEVSTQADLLEALGRCCYSKGEYVAAMQYWRDCLTAALAAARYPAFVRAQVGLGQILFGYERFEAALEHHRQAFNYLHLVEDPRLCGMVHINIAQDLYYLARLDEADIALQSAYDILLPAQSLQYETEIYRMRGQLALARHEVGEAHVSFMAARKICRLLGYQWGEVMSLIGIAECCLAELDWLTARETLETTLTLVENDHSSPHLHYRIHAALAKACTGLGDAAGAEDHHHAYQQHYDAFHNTLPAEVVASAEDKTSQHEMVGVLR